MPSFTASLWHDVADVYAAILDHPFLRGLVDGSLERDAFAHYVIQDAHYLRAYARALAVTGAKAPHDSEIAMFCQHAAGAVEVERELHATLFGELGITAEAAEAAEVAPTTEAYSSYLLAAAYGGSYAEAVGAVLPCYWIYWEVGKELVAKGSDDPSFQRWIDTYADDAFGSIVGEVLDVTERLGPSLGADEAARVRERFVATSRYEWMFWDAAYRREQWPLATS